MFFFVHQQFWGKTSLLWKFYIVELQVKTQQYTLTFVILQIKGSTFAHDNTEHGNTEHGNTEHGNTEHGNTAGNSCSAAYNNTADEHITIC